MISSTTYLLINWNRPWTWPIYLYRHKVQCWRCVVDRCRFGFSPLCPNFCVIGQISVPGFRCDSMSKTRRTVKLRLLSMAPRNCHGLDTHSIGCPRLGPLRLPWRHQTRPTPLLHILMTTEGAFFWSSLRSLKKRKLQMPVIKQWFGNYS